MKRVHALQGRLESALDWALLPRGVSHLVFAGLLALAVVTVWLYSVVGNDDAFIYFRVVENLLAGKGPVFNEGDDFTLATSPAWMLILAAGRLITGMPLPDLAKGLSVAFLAGGATLLYALLLRRLPSLAPLAALPALLTLHTAPLIGQDTAMALCAGLLLVLCVECRAPMWFAVAAAFAYLTRGEYAVVSVSLLCVWYWSARRSRSTPVLEFVRPFVPGAAVALILVAAWHVWHFNLFGTFFPRTLDAKMLQGQAGWDAFLSAAPAHVAGIFPPSPRVAVFIAAIGALAAWRPLALLLIWPAVHFVTYGLLGVAYYPWYYYPVDAALMLLLVAGATAAVGLAGRLFRFGGRFRQPAMFVALALLLATLLPVQADALVRTPLHLADVWIRGSNLVLAQGNARYYAYRSFAAALRQAPYDARPATLLTPEIGILGYLLPGMEVRDLVGLATPAASADELWNWKLHVDRFQPECLAGSDGMQLKAFLDSHPEMASAYAPVRTSAGPTWHLYCKPPSTW